MHSSCMHENACKCANLLACLMHALHACGMHAACMPACMIHACSAGMHSLEGLVPTKLQKPFITGYRSAIKVLIKVDIVNMLRMFLSQQNSLA